MPEAMPKSLLVMGSGAIGIEFASFYRTMGAEVTVVEVLPQILPVEDEEIAALARKRFEKQGIKILTGAKVTKVEKGARLGQGDRRGRRRQDADHRGRPADLGRRRRRQHRESRPREARGEDRARLHRHRRRRHGPMSPASMRSATSPGRPCWPTRPSTRASSASRRSPASIPIRSRRTRSRAAPIARRRSPASD